MTPVLRTAFQSCGPRVDPDQRVKVRQWRWLPGVFPPLAVWRGDAGAKFAEVGPVPRLSSGVLMSAFSALLDSPTHTCAQDCNSSLASLPAREKGLLAPFVQDVFLLGGLLLYEAGDPIDYVYFPHSAVISQVATLEEGEGIITTLTGWESACGTGVALDGPLALSRAVVLISGTASRVAVAEFRAVCQNSVVIREVAARCNALLITQLHLAAACNACHSLEGRLSRWLLECSDRVGSAVQLKQRMLAHMLGTNRTSVTLVARRLQSSGAIGYRRGVIHILNRAALEASACECYRTLRQRADSFLPQIPEAESAIQG